MIEERNHLLRNRRGRLHSAGTAAPGGDGVGPAPRAPHGCELADMVPGSIPFTQRLACTITEACEASGIGRTKLYELIGNGRLETTTIGRRRLVLVGSLLSLFAPRRQRADSHGGKRT